MAVDNTILVRRGSGTPSHTDFTEYELAYDYSGNKLYIRDGNAMVEIGGGTITSVSGMTNNNVLTASGSTTISGESSLQFAGQFLSIQGNDPSNTYGVKEKLRIHRSGNNTDRQLQIYEMRHSGGREFLQAFNLDITTDNSSAYTYTQGSYGGSSYIEFDNAGALKFYNDSGVSSGSRDAITPSLSMWIKSDNHILMTGRLGIGWTSGTPARALDVKGGIELSVDDNTIDTNNFTLRRGSSGVGHLDSPGNIRLNIDSNNNQTTAFFEICANASTTPVFKVGETGIVTTGTWNGTAIASAYLDADTAHLSTTQTFSGAKTFSDSVRITGSTKYLYIDNDAENESGIWFRDNQDPNGQYGKILFDSNGSTNALNFHVQSGTPVLKLQTSSMTVTGTASISSTLQMGSSATQSNAKISAISNGNNITFGHVNSAGYRSHLGCSVNNGYPFLAFYSEAGTNNNTFRTRGLKGVVLQADTSGKFSINHVANTSADNQSLSKRFEIDGSGNITTGVWQGTAVGLAYGGTGATSATGARSNLGLGTGATLNTAAVSDGATTLATGNAIYDHVTSRISGLATTASLGDLALVDSIAANKVVSGTFNIARIPTTAIRSNYRLSTDASNDANSASTSGVYRIDSGYSNLPSMNYGTLVSFNNLSDTGFQLAADYHAGGGSLYWRGGNSSTFGGTGSNTNWFKVWNEDNDGSGSGLDADLLDGVQGSSYWTKSGSWVGDLASNGYTRIQGVSNGGGEFVLALKNGQLNTLVDGSYFAYEGNTAAGGGFWSSYNSAYANATGFKASGTSTIKVIQQDGGDGNLTVTGNITAEEAIISTSRDEGVFGVYDPAKTDHIWSMGTAYKNHASGTNFGNL